MNVNSKSLINHKIAYYQYFFMGAVSVYSIQILPLFYDYYNYTELQIASLISLSFFAAILQPLIGIITDKYINVRNMLIILALISAITISLISVVDQFIILYPIVFILSIARLSQMPLYDGYNIKLIQHSKGNYGFIRSGGSLGFGITLIIILIILNIFKLDLAYSALVIIIFTIISLLFSIKTPYIHIKEQINKQVSHKSNIKLYSLIVIFNMLMFGFVSLRIAYQTTYLLEFNYSENFISILIFLMIIPEMIFLPISAKLFSRLRITTVFFIATSLFLIQLILLMLFPTNIFILIFSTMIHGVIIGMYLPALTSALGHTLAPQVVSTGFMFNMMIQSFVVGVFNQIVIASIYDLYKSTIYVYLIMFICVLFAYIPLLIIRLKKYDVY